MSDLDGARRFALSLPGVTEEPHFEMSSFRVRGRIFATAPPDGDRLHVFVDEAEVEACLAEDPAAFERLRWGQRVRGLRVLLAAASADRVRELIEDSWRRKAPQGLIAELDRISPVAGPPGGASCRPGGRTAAGPRLDSRRPCAEGGVR